MFAALALTLLPLPNPAPAPAPNAKDVKAAVKAALPLLQKGAAGHAEQQRCFACHNQATAMLAFSLAKDRGFDLAADLLKTQIEHIVGFIDSNRDRFKDGRGTGGQAATASYMLFTLELAGHKADENTDAVVGYLLKTQAERDHWRMLTSRPPTESSDFTTTYLTLRALRVWGPAAKLDKTQVAKRVEAARGWLVKTPTKETEDRVFRLLGLKEAGADAKEVTAAAWELLKTQRADGGWSQLDGQRSDPYATGSALVALHEAGGLKADSPAYRAGLAFLLKTQRTDGSWLVRSRSRPFQPYYESGFPHEKNQFISMAASGWATAALALAVEKK